MSLQLADVMALGAQQDGVRTTADAKVRVASEGIIKLLPPGFAQFADKSEFGHAGENGTLY